MKEDWAALLSRPQYLDVELESKVKRILDDVKSNGDKALFRFSQEFDKVNLRQLLVAIGEQIKAEGLISDSLKGSIDAAYSNIRKFHQAQLKIEDKIETAPGVVCWRKAVAIENVGLYIPGGSAPLFSTVLMLGIPAQIAGCKRVVLCTPPDKNGAIHPAILYAAKIVGISEVYKIGGAQAIAAMAYGTKSIKKVDKVFGPGNNYVTVAKQLLQSTGLAIDMPAGPSEVAILADDTAIPSFVAADLLSQAEHGSDSQVLLVTTSKALIEKVSLEIEVQQNQLPRKEMVKGALLNSRMFLVETLEQGMDLLNEYAPEHLIIACNKAEALAEQVINAGSVFIGKYSPESAGDYASGTNHTLPTNGWAKTYSGVSVDSFIRKITFQHLSKEGLKGMAIIIETMAEAEGLAAHKNAVSIRFKTSENEN